MRHDDCFYQVLGLSNRLIEAVETDNWTLVSTLQQQWMREVRQCVDHLMEVAPAGEVEEKLQRLLEDVAEKTAILERAIETLRARQQQDLRQLQQASAYLEQS